MSILSLCEWLENTPVGVSVRESMYGFPILVAIHVLGLTVSVGTLMGRDAMHGSKDPSLSPRIMQVTYMSRISMLTRSAESHPEAFYR